MKTVEVTIEGISPLLMHAFPMNPIEAMEKKTREEQAEIAAYRDPDNKGLFVPSVAIQRALISGATYSKGKGRGNLSRSAAACLNITPERVSLGTKDYSIDSRPVVVPATKGRVIRHRPRLEKWNLSFDLEYDESLITREQVHRIISDTGQRVGLLDFRPEKRGPFGRFHISSFE